MVRPRHLLALGTGLSCGRTYAARLHISHSERGRYYRKISGLALCYADIPGALPLGRTLAVAAAAGRAAFLCCGYDVVTDWRHFDRQAYRTFELILREMVTDSEARAIAQHLYAMERSGDVGNDGLDRGDAALRFVLSLMSLERAAAHTWSDVTAVGQLLQIVDDVLDYEHDVRHDELNCLRTPKRTAYLRQLLSSFDDTSISATFGMDAPVLSRVIHRARTKARAMLLEDHASCRVVICLSHSCRAPTSIEITPRVEPDLG